MRYERKYNIEDYSRQLVEQILRLHPASFRKAFPDRQVNNIYFDTPSLLTFHDNLSGVAEREKYRLRWYGKDITYLEEPVFEIKIKNNQLGKKQSTPLESMDIGDSRMLEKKVNAFHSGSFVLRPVLVNAYRRAYYSTADGRFRITLDTDLRFGAYRRRSTRLNNFLPNRIILELKYEASLDELTDRIIQYLPFRHSKSSKYVTGILLLNGR